MEFQTLSPFMTDALLYLQDFNTVSICIRLLLAAFFGGVLGTERSKKHFGAGTRTYALVCLGSAATIIVNEYVRMKANNAIDPARIAAQIINGIGFLGAGTIMVTKNNRVKGLTNAACLWVSAIIGIAVGSGFILGGILGFLFALFSILGLQHVHDWFTKYDRLMELYLEIDSDTGLEQLQAFMSEHHFSIKTLHRRKQKALFSGDHCITVEFDMGEHHDHDDILKKLNRIDSIHYYEEI